MARAEDIVLPGGRTIPSGILRFRFDRSGGPGGQNVNKLNTKATLTVDLAELAERMPASAMARLQQLAGPHLADDRLVIASDATRSQASNRADCVEKLRQLLVRALHRPKRRRATRPTVASRQRRLDAKKRRAATKHLRRRPRRDE